MDLITDELPSEHALALSKRELECMYHFMRGLSAKQVGRALNLSPRTIETHFEHIKKKLKCRRRSDVISRVHDDAVLYAQVIDCYGSD